MEITKITNDTTTDNVKVVMMNGYEMEIGIFGVDAPHDIKREVECHLFRKLMMEYNEKYGDEPTNRRSIEWYDWEKQRVEEVYIPSEKYEWRFLILLDGERIVENHDNLVVTDETILTVVIDRVKYELYQTFENDDDHDESDDEEDE